MIIGECLPRREAKRRGKYSLVITDRETEVKKDIVIDIIYSSFFHSFVNYETNYLLI